MYRSYRRYIFLFALIFGFAVLRGVLWVDRINQLLMVGLVFSYLFIIGKGSQEVSMTRLDVADWSISWIAAPVLFGAYGYHNLIPSLVVYLQRDVRALRRSLILGTFLAFCVYASWQWLILGTLTAEQLSQGAIAKESIGVILSQVSASSWMQQALQIFSFCALVTSALGVSLSMVDAIGDGFNISRQGRSRFILCLVVFIPPLLITLKMPGLFLTALGIAGGFGEALLNGLLPVALVFIGRYIYRLATVPMLSGGRISIAILSAITVAIVIAEAFLLLH